MQLQQQVLTGQNDFMIESTTFAVRLATLSFRKEWQLKEITAHDLEELLMLLLNDPSSQMCVYKILLKQSRKKLKRIFLKIFLLFFIY